MNLQEIRTILDSEITREAKEERIIKEISRDEKSITRVLLMIDQERRTKDALIADLHLTVATLDLYIEVPDAFAGADKNSNKAYVIKKVSNLYAKYKGIISNPFNRYKS